MAFLESFVKHSSGKFYYNLDNYTQAKLLYDELVKKESPLDKFDDPDKVLAYFASDESDSCSLSGCRFRAQTIELSRKDSEAYAVYVIFYYMPL